MSIFLSAVSAGAAVAAPAPQPRCDTHYFGVGNGEEVSVFCDFGPTDRFRVVAYCEGPVDSWNGYGSVGYTGFQPSRAECHGPLLGNAHVGGYRVEWM
ncbi:hypothetical protein GCM10029964_050570 [Kibdelosporangium lantanae]